MKTAAMFLRLIFGLTIIPLYLVGLIVLPVIGLFFALYAYVLTGKTTGELE